MLNLKIFIAIFSMQKIFTISFADQKADDMCFVSYSQEAGRCNSETENEEDKFDFCLKKAKANLVKCCKDHKGSKSCAADAE